MECEKSGSDKNVIKLSENKNNSSQEKKPNIHSQNLYYDQLIRYVNLL